MIKHVLASSVAVYSRCLTSDTQCVNHLFHAHAPRPFDQNPIAAVQYFDKTRGEFIMTCRAKHPLLRKTTLNRAPGNFSSQSTVGKEPVHSLRSERSDMVVQLRTSWPQLKHISQNGYTPTSRTKIVHSIQGSVD